MRFTLVLLILLLVLNACKQQSQPPVKEILKEVTTPKAPVKKVNKHIIPKGNDTINRENTVAFLTAYGKENPETIVLFETRLGNIKIKLYSDTPLHRASFIFLTKVGYFSTTCVHRIVEYFVVQGGNSEHPKTRRYRSKYQSYTIPAEFRSHRKHNYGALAAARDWDNNPTKRSTPFEFYFMQDENGGHHLDGEHTVFGEIIDGFDTLEKIAKEKVGNDEWPIIDVCFKATVLE
tara:strand:+ start:789375 stop:790076 length:702 start_codon:yes stop_codon:yes gene_type:complete